MRTRLWLLVVLAAVAGAGCAGETFVTYRGTVSAAGSAGHSFDGEPATASPIAGAMVALRLCPGSCVGDEAALRTITDDAGVWGPLDVDFGSGFTNHEIRIEVAAAGFGSYLYTTVYETTGDPTAGERHLNVRLRPG